MNNSLVMLILNVSKSILYNCLKSWLFGGSYVKRSRAVVHCALHLKVCEVYSLVVLAFFDILPDMYHFDWALNTSPILNNNIKHYPGFEVVLNIKFG